MVLSIAELVCVYCHIWRMKSGTNWQSVHLSKSFYLPQCFEKKEKKKQEEKKEEEKERKKTGKRETEKRSSHRAAHMIILQCASRGRQRWFRKKGTVSYYSSKDGNGDNVQTSLSDLDLYARFLESQGETFFFVAGLQAPDRRKKFRKKKKTAVKGSI